jgi:hypothetical protein
MITVTISQSVVVRYHQVSAASARAFEGRIGET